MKKLMLLLAIVLLSGCSNTYSVDSADVEVSQYLCGNNGEWQKITILSTFNDMNIQCFDGSFYQVVCHYTHGYFYVKNSMDKNINKRVNDIMGGLKRKKCVDSM